MYVNVRSKMHNVSKAQLCKHVCIECMRRVRHGNALHEAHLAHVVAMYCVQ